MRVTRLVLAAFACALFSVLVDAAFDGAWPDHSVGWWLVFVEGVVVIAALFAGLQDYFSPSKSTARTSSDS